MAESERLDAAQPQQIDEPKQPRGDEGDKDLEGGGEELEPVFDDEGEGEEGYYGDEGGEDEDRRGELSTAVAEVEEGAGAELLRSRPEEKSGNLGAAAAAVPEKDQCVAPVDDLAGSSGNPASEARTEAEFKEQVGSSQQEALEDDPPQDAKAETENGLQLSVCPAPASELSPTSVTQPVSAGTSPTVPEQRLPLSKCTSGPVQEADQPEPSDIRKLVIPVPKTATPDGYNWRKYGQKQVKSPYGSRSYYRCTHSDCFVKKIECTDHCGHVIEIVNKGMHSHDPPRKSNSKRVSRIASFGGRTSEDVITQHASRLKESDPAMPLKEPTEEKAMIAHRKRLSPSGSSENDPRQIKEEHACVSEPKKRMKMDDLDCSGALTKTEKKPKFVVHAACDVGISGDGYRWRKYGQKMVKGNSHPRNYYRCTSAGCPVRKHIETAADNSSSVFITYKGIHDHDKPVPKKRQGPPSAPLITAAAAAASMNNAVQQQNKRTVPPLKPETSLTVGGDERKDKAVESTARALISIGFEIKPC
ncbi:unnamed protein product [Linum tenue]|uniref:WRKY domain-containing protein n=1 Tax=Linum tenue TaxID=586396 RepID=A0AAV0IAK8_9ROSI|nr:unnamed protein product [Linum tenue]